MSLFINYWARPRRASPLNLMVARMLVGLYAAWKVGTYPFAELASFPPFLFLENELARQNTFFAPSPEYLSLIPWEQALLVVCLLLVAAGWRLGLTAGLSAALLAHLSGLNYLIINEKTFLPIVYFLIFCGLYRHQDSGTWDRWRRSRGQAPESLKASLLQHNAGPPPAALYPPSALRAFLLTFSLIYFFTGWAKWCGGGHGWAWAAAENVRLIVQKNALYHIHEMPPAASLVMPHDLAFAVMGNATLLLELGFVLAVLARLPITPFILGLAGMHAGILATMQLNYLTDMLPLYALFLPWDGLARRLAPTGSWTVTYDGRCRFCLRILQVFRILDVARRLRFVEAPAEAAAACRLCVQGADGIRHEHVDALSILLGCGGLTRPLAWLVRRGPMRARMGQLARRWTA